MTEKTIAKNDIIKSFQKICKEQGLKLTHQRLEIFTILANMKIHPSAEEVFEQVKQAMPTISFDTVYRTLALFERHDVISRVHCLDDRTRYDPIMKPHYHFVCKKCRKIQDFFWPDLDKLQVPSGAANGGIIEGKYLELRGICQDCLAAK